MSAIAVNNIDSMAALHLSHREAGKWYDGFEEGEKKAWKSVKSPIVIGSARPVGYSPSFVNNPLGACQTFTLFKQFNSPRPFHNAFVKYMLNPNGPYRNLWCDMVVLPLKTYAKDKDEIRKRVIHTKYICKSNHKHIHLEQSHIVNIPKKTT
jgi:hypothetical protein